MKPINIFIRKIFGSPLIKPLIIYDVKKSIHIFFRRGRLVAWKIEREDRSFSFQLRRKNSNKMNFVINSQRKIQLNYMKPQRNSNKYIVPVVRNFCAP